MRRIFFWSILLLLMSSCAKEEEVLPLTNDELIAFDSSALPRLIGRDVDITVKLSENVYEEEGRFFQKGWLDGELMAYPILFEVHERPLTSHYAHVRGMVGRVETANHLFDEVVLHIDSATVSPLTYFDMYDPTVERREVSRHQTVNDVTVQIDHVERTTSNWRLFVRIYNGTDETVTLYAEESILRVQQRAVRGELPPLSRFSLPHRIEPHSEVEGVIVYPIASSLVPWTWTFQDDLYSFHFDVK